jgi:hypothetical protein
VISLDSSGGIDLEGQEPHLLNQFGGSILFNGPGTVTSFYDDNSQSFSGTVENAGSIVKSGTDTLRLHCSYNQPSGGTFSLQGGIVHAWEFGTNGQVTLASGTAVILGDDLQYGNVNIDADGVLELQGTSSITGNGSVGIGGQLRHTLAGISVIDVTEGGTGERLMSKRAKWFL